MALKKDEPKTLKDKVKDIMHGDGLKLQNAIMRHMFGYDDETTSTGKTPDEINLAPTMNDVYGFYEHVTFTFGRFSIPHAGHDKLIRRVLDEASGDHFVFVSQSFDEQNPIMFESKIDIMKEIWPDVNIYAGNDVRTFFQAIEFLEHEGYKSATLVVGADRYLEFQKLLEKYADEYSMVIGIVSVDRTDDSESATQMRQFVKENDRSSFANMTPCGAEWHIIDRLFEEAKNSSIEAQHKHLSSYHKITNPKHEKAIREYSDASDSINMPLIKKQPMHSEHIDTHLNLLHMHKENPPLKRDHHVYSNMGSFDPSKSKHGIFHSDAHLSTSLDPSVADNHETPGVKKNQQHILHAHLPKGYTHGRYIGDQSSFKGKREYEMLLAPNQRFKITHSEKRADGSTVHHAVPHTDLKEQVILTMANNRIPMAGYTDGKIGDDADIKMSDIQRKRRKTAKRFKQIVDET